MVSNLDVKKEKSLSEASYSLGLMLGLPPIAASAVIQHVFQILAEQFYLSGYCELPNLGSLVFHDGEAIFLPCEALNSTTRKIADALESRQFSFAGCEMQLEAAERGAKTTETLES